MTQTTKISSSNVGKYDMDNGLVPNESLVVSRIDSKGQGDEAEKECIAYGPEEPTAAIVKDLDPPDGGYGWVVVAYLFCPETVINR